MDDGDHRHQEEGDVVAKDRRYGLGQVPHSCGIRQRSKGTPNSIRPTLPRADVEISATSQGFVKLAVGNRGREPAGLRQYLARPKWCSGAGRHQAAGYVPYFPTDFCGPCGEAKYPQTLRSGGSRLVDAPHARPICGRDGRRSGSRRVFQRVQAFWKIEQALVLLRLTIRNRSAFIWARS